MTVKVDAAKIRVVPDGAGRFTGKSVRPPSEVTATTSIVASTVVLELAEGGSPLPGPGASAGSVSLDAVAACSVDGHFAVALSGADGGSPLSGSFHARYCADLNW